MDRPRRPEPVEPDRPSDQTPGRDTSIEPAISEAVDSPEPSIQQDTTDPGYRAVEGRPGAAAGPAKDSLDSRGHKEQDDRPDQTPIRPVRDGADSADQHSGRDTATSENAQSSSDSTSIAQDAADRAPAGMREKMLEDPRFTRLGWGSGDEANSDDGADDGAHSGKQVEDRNIETKEQAPPERRNVDDGERTAGVDPARIVDEERARTDEPAVADDDAESVHNDVPYPAVDATDQSRDPVAKPESSPDTPEGPSNDDHHNDSIDDDVSKDRETADRWDLFSADAEVNGEIVQPAGRPVDESDGLSLAAIDPAPSASPGARLERSLTSEDGDQLTPDVSVMTEDEAQRRDELGYDPAVKQFRPGETETALRIESERGVQLERAQSADEKYDWVDSDGRTYDAIGNFPAKFLDRQWDNLKEKVEHHLEKADFVPIDVARFTPEQCQRIRDTFAVYYPRVFIVGDDGFDGRND